jgi:hypothetical protein
MIHLIYISSATGEPSDDDLMELLEQSRARNKKQNVTGMLLYRDGAFLQVLEGEEKDVDEIYQSICLDKRNAGNYLIERKVIEERNFPDWSMGFVSLTKCVPPDLQGYLDIFDKAGQPAEIAKHKDMAVELLRRF